MNHRSLPNLENDYRIFLWFLTLTTGAMYAWSAYSSPQLRQNPLLLVVCTLLLIIHIILHWFTSRIYKNQRLLIGYILIQGALAFSITLMTNLLALFLGLVGEAIGMMGLSRGGVLGSAYYLALSFAVFLIFSAPAEIIWWLIAVIPAILFVGVYVTLYNRQTEANERARELLAQLETANRQLSEYAAQVEDLTIAAERQRMARELHDTLSQGLAGVILQLEAADAHLNQDRPEKARGIIQQAMQQARTTLSAARQAIDNLRNAAAPSLEEALRQQVERFGSMARIDCALEITPPVKVTPEQQEAITRIVSEALMNIHRHAKASHVRIQLCGDGSGIQLEIRDDGVGFDPFHTPPGHYGLIGIRERARLAGGELVIHSQPGSGTQIIVCFPRSGIQA
jgi:NarL family two-component system sensor histidine kinase YdfH